MKVNFLITCFDKEEFADFFRYTILPKFKKIEPIITLAYNGAKNDYPCQIRTQNQGLQLGEYNLILEAYKHAKGNQISKFIKVSADSWLCDEDILLSIFEKMEQNKCGYGGNFWFPGPRQDALSTDIFFADTRFGNLFEHLGAPKDDFCDLLEFKMNEAVGAAQTQAFIIQEREPTHPNYRFSCDALKWTMEHDLKANILKYNQWENKAI